MNLIICDNDFDVARAAADRIARDVDRRPHLVLGLPTGRTSIPLYARLAEARRAGQCRFDRVVTFNLDEFVGLPASHPGSYRAFMARHCFEPLGIPPSHVHFLDGVAPDLEAECVSYEQQLADAGGTDLQVLGLGANGHIGFNEPADALHARTHCVRLCVETRVANAGLFGGVLDRVPTEALSMGMATILEARALVLVAYSADKRDAVTAMVEGLLTPRWPASFLQLHPRVDVYLDEDAASGLSPGTRRTARRRCDDA
ncbi:MAG: glucosamine-6-phosphate deaminase [Vicinamibacterales bacterium]